MYNRSCNLLKSVIFSLDLLLFPIYQCDLLTDFVLHYSPSDNEHCCSLMLHHIFLLTAVMTQQRRFISSHCPEEPLRWVHAGKGLCRTSMTITFNCRPLAFMGKREKSPVNIKTKHKQISCFASTKPTDVNNDFDLKQL